MALLCDESWEGGGGGGRGEGGEGGKEASETLSRHTKLAIFADSYM